MRRFQIIELVVMFVTILQWLVLATVTGVLVGSLCSLFLKILFMAEGRLYDASLWSLALILPLSGLVNGVLLHYGYLRVPAGLHDEPVIVVNEQAGRMPLSTLWIKPVAALVTLVGGGSAGKEGPCSHIGAGIAAAVSQLLRLNVELRKRMVACGVSAGFASVFGTPIAGAIYGIEMLAIGRIRHDFLFPGIVAGVTAYVTSCFWGITYPQYAINFEATFTQLLFLKTVAVGVLCGLAALCFVELRSYVQLIFNRLRTRFSLWPPLLPVLGGMLLVGCCVVVSTDYLGLSLPLIDRALQGETMPITGFFWKALFVAITLGSGFYGGIVTPQFVIGAVAGGACAPLLGLSPEQGAAVGLVAVVAAASNTPIAAVLMGVELFGADSIWYVAGACVSAFLMIGHRSVYPAQRLAYAKSAWLVATPNLPVGQEKVQLAYGLLRWWHGVWQKLKRRQK